MAADQDTSSAPVKTGVQAAGGHGHKGEADGVSAAPEGGNVHGRADAGESGGGGYPNPKRGKQPTSDRFMGHGGQTDIGYHGGQQAGNTGESRSNATTRGDDDFGKAR